MDHKLEEILADYASMIGYAFSEPLIFSGREKPFDNGDLVIFSALAFALVGEYAAAREYINSEERYNFYRKAANYILASVLNRQVGKLIASKDQRIFWEPLTKLMSDLSFAGSEARFEDYKGIYLDANDSIGRPDFDSFLDNEINEFVSIYEEFAQSGGLNKIDPTQRKLLKREYVGIAQAGADNELLKPDFIEHCRKQANLPC